MHSLQSLEHQQYVKGNPQKTSNVNTATSLSELAEDKTYSTDKFLIYQDDKFQRSTVVIDIQGITFKDASNNVLKSFKFDDVLGATFKRPNTKTKKWNLEEGRAKWIYNAYALKVHILAKPPTEAKEKEADQPPPERKYEKFVLFHDDHIWVSKFRNFLLHVANNPNFQSDLLSDKLDIFELPEYRRHLLVFVMAKSGQGKAKERWEICRKLLIKGGCTFKEMFIDDFQVLKDFLEKSTAEDLRKFDVISSVSGDGIPHSVINILMNRPDWGQISDIPLMLIPGGSCNALSQNILSRSGESTTLESCSYLLAKGRKMKSDLTVLELQDGRKIISFLELTWASVANIDLDSETLRSLGCRRFDIYGAWECLTLKKYKARFYYSEMIKRPPKFNVEPKGEGWDKIDDDFSYFSIHNMPWVGLNYEAIPFLELEDGINYFMAQKGEQVTRKNLLNTRKLLRRNKGKINEEKDLENLGMTVGKIKSFRLEPYGERLGKYSIDGEEYDVMPIQGYVLEKAIYFVGYPKNH